MKHYLLSTFGALLVLAGIGAIEARAESQNEAQGQSQEQVASQAPAQLQAEAPVQAPVQAPNQTQAQASVQVQGQPVCGTRTAFVQRLKERYSEQPISIGLATNGVVIEVFAASSGSFTILVTRPEGVSCLVASGEGWQELPTQKADLKI